MGVFLCVHVGIDRDSDLGDIIMIVLINLKVHLERKTNPLISPHQSC